MEDFDYDVQRDMDFSELLGQENEQEKKSNKPRNSKKKKKKKSRDSRKRYSSVPKDVHASKIRALDLKRYEDAPLNLETIREVGSIEPSSTYKYFPEYC